MDKDNKKKRESVEITIAEIRGKLPPEFEGKENLLTSDVFGTLKNIDRQRGLKKFLSKLGIEISKEEAEDAEFLFWRRFEDRTEPDVIIDTRPGNKGGCLIVLEAKYLSPLGWDETQLIREYKNGSEMAREKGKLFYLICVTKDFTEPKEVVDDAKKRICSELGVKLDRNEVKWINWQTILAMLTNIIDDRDLDLPSKRQIEDLIELLKFKGLEYFTGFMREEIVLLSEALESVEKITKDIFRLAGNLSEELKSHDILLWENKILRDGTSGSLSDFSYWNVSYFTLTYFKEDWWDNLGLYDVILFVKVFLIPLEVWVGCTLEIKREGINSKKTYYDENFPMNNFVSWLDKDLEKTEILEDYKPLEFEVRLLDKKEYFGHRIVLYKKISYDKLTSNDGLKEIMKQVMKFADIAPKISKYLEEKPLCVGTRVKALWEEDGKYYAGRIAEIKEGKFRIKFDDGDEGIVTRENMYRV